jgi:predicted metal-dependent hydrolase
MLKLPLIEPESTAMEPTVLPRPSVPRPRDPAVDLDRPLPRHWFGGNAVATHISNGINLLFPAGERFFVRSVNHYLERIGDPLLCQQIKGFFGQEGRHAKEHERVFRQLEEQGYAIRGFLRLYERVVFGGVERLLPPALNLAATAACEHFTAMLAEDSLRRRILDYAHPRMRALLLWHAAEEIEHRAVAFDVLQEVSPSYGVRVAGLAVATACLGSFWTLGTLMLLWQDRKLGPARLRADWRVTRERERLDSPQSDGDSDGGGLFLRGIREYLRRDFHPLKKATDQLAADYLASVGLPS